jgi:hypothetical protein
VFWQVSAPVSSRQDVQTRVADPQRRVAAGFPLELNLRDAELPFSPRVGCEVDSAARANRLIGLPISLRIGVWLAGCRARTLAGCDNGKHLD